MENYNNRSFNICLSLLVIFVLIVLGCLGFENSPYAKQRLLKFDENQGFLTRLWFPVGMTDSIMIIHEDHKGEFDYNNPIISYSLINTSDHMMVSEIINDTIFVFYRNSKLNLKCFKEKVLIYPIKIELIKTHELIEKEKKLDETNKYILLE